MKTKSIIFIVIAFLLVLSFFFKIIPIPVENIEGSKNPDEFIFGGFYWTSILHQLTLGNFLGAGCMFLIFISLSAGNKFIIYKEN